MEADTQFIELYFKLLTGVSYLYLQLMQAKLELVTWR